MLFGKTGSRRIDKGSILENITGNSAGDYYGCNFKRDKDRYEYRWNYL